MKEGMPGQEFQAGTVAGTMAEMLLTSLLPKTHTACFLIYPGTTCPALTPPTAEPPKICLQASLVGVPLSR